MDHLRLLKRQLRHLAVKIARGPRIFLYQAERRRIYGHSASGTITTLLLLWDFFLIIKARNVVAASAQRIVAAKDCFSSAEAYNTSSWNEFGTLGWRKKLLLRESCCCCQKALGALMCPVIKQYRPHWAFAICAVRALLISVLSRANLWFSVRVRRWAHY